VALTTNGVLLDHLARPLREAGLAQVNVSVDTLDEKRFRQLTRWGNLRDVLAGIESAERAGLRIKLNAVVVRGVNDTADAVALARLTLDRPWQVRFIEMMPFAGISDFQLSHSVPEEELRATIAAALGPLDYATRGGWTARRGYSDSRPRRARSASSAQCRSLSVRAATVRG
jgi:cyclic pyranopterin phosphate synthase